MENEHSLQKKEGALRVYGDIFHYWIEIAPHKRPDALEGERITKLSLQRNNTIVYAYDGTVTIVPPDDNTRLALEILLHTENHEEE